MKATRPFPAYSSLTYKLTARFQGENHFAIVTQLKEHDLEDHRRLRHLGLAGTETYKQSDGSPGSSAKKRIKTSGPRIPAVASGGPTHELEGEEDLPSLAPKGRLVAVKTLEGSVIEIGKTEKAQRNLRICVPQRSDCAARLILAITIRQRSCMTRSSFNPTCVRVRTRCGIGEPPRLDAAFR